MLAFLAFYVIKHYWGETPQGLQGILVNFSIFS
jgi:hypothetical protein